VLAVARCVPSVANHFTCDSPCQSTRTWHSRQKLLATNIDINTTHPYSMCANATSTTASSSPFAATGRSLFSRLTNPLKSRTRNLTDFYIRPQEPHRQYSPGDLVRGAVILTVVKPIRLTHLTVCLHGFVRVFKNPNGANEPLPVDAVLTASSDPKKSQYFGNGHASLFQDEVTLCGEGRLDAGVYEFNFELEFPTEGLPTSIDVRSALAYHPPVCKCSC
jgi:hypothetical protein